MCGINVVYDPAGTLDHRADVVGAMNLEMVYRGPDGGGAFSDGPLTLGMRRLSIIDLVHGQQPLFNEDRSLALVCNGEIYNYVELREALRARGHTFATESDCEVILHLYEEHQERCVDHLRGMFAFALWDRKNQRLVAARDRLGIKPLYVARSGRRVALSSELKTLVKARLASASVDYEVLYQTMRHSHPIDERRTLACDVDRLPPGSLLVADARGIREQRYWSPAFGASSEACDDDQLSDTLAEAVRIHLRSDVPVAVLLSAGIDSGAIAALSKHAKIDALAVSVGYRGQHACDERVQAAALAHQLGMRWTPVELDSNDFPKLFTELARHCDEPACDIASMAQWALYRACRELGCKVVLSGLGGDELFFGYPAWNAAGETLARRARLERLLPPSIHAAITAVGGLVPRLRNRFGAAWPGVWTGLSRSPIVANNERVLRWLGADRAGAASRRADRLVLDLEQRAAPGPDAMYSFLLRAYLPNNGFLLADKLGMGNSVEVRTPLADNVLVERVLGLPLHRRFSHAQSKPLLKRLVARHLPGEVLERPKQGFSPPQAFVQTIIRERADAVLSAPELQGWLDRRRLSQLLHAAGTERRAGSRLPDASWVLYGLAAFVESRAGWRSS